MNHFGWLQNAAKAESTLATKLETKQKGTSMNNYVIDSTNHLYSTIKNSDRLKAVGLETIKNKPLWPVNGLHKLMMFECKENCIYSGDEEFYDLMTIMAYSATLNNIFAMVTDERSCQLNFLSFEPNDGGIFSVYFDL